MNPAPVVKPPPDIGAVLRRVIDRHSAACDLALLPTPDRAARDRVVALVRLALGAHDAGDTFRLSRLLICLISQPDHDILYDIAGGWVNVAIYDWLRLCSTAWAVWLGDDPVCLDIGEGGVVEAHNTLHAFDAAMPLIAAHLHGSGRAMPPHIYLCRVAAVDGDGMLMPGCARVRLPLGAA